MADAGWDFYAPVTFSGVPGRTVWLGWMADPAYAGEAPSEGWNGRMTLAREAEGSRFRHGAFTGVRRCALPAKGTDVDFLVVADHGCIEVFLQKGALVLSALAFPEKGHDGFAVTALGDCDLMRFRISR